MRFGVEEEFFVVDPAGRDVVPKAKPVLAEAWRSLGPRVTGEDTELQVECRTLPCGTAAELDDQIRDGRHRMASAAAAGDLAIVASGTPVLGGTIPAPIVAGPRAELTKAGVRGLLFEYSHCALHVHVEMPDRDHAVLLSNRLRPHLPSLLAVTANSPYWCERDTGYASWRTLLWSRWPVAGPPPYFRSAAHYDALVARFMEAEALIDEADIYWDVRPSAKQPTLEVRVADIPMTAEESVSYAALVRGLAVSLRPAVERGDRGPVLEPELMRLAYWRAARDGWSGAGIDVETGATLPITEIARRLLEAARPGLEEHGDLDRVETWLRRVGETGDGAARQRRAFAGRGRLDDVVDHLIEQTTMGARPSETVTPRRRSRRPEPR